MTPRDRDMVVVGFSDREQSIDAVRLGSRLAEALDAELAVATVFEFAPVPVQAGDYGTLRDQHYADVFARAEKALGGAEFRRFELTGPPGRALFDLAEREQPRILVLGSTHRGPVRRVLLGTVAQALVSAGPCAIAVAPRGYAEQAEEGILRIAVAANGSPESSSAVLAGVLLAKRLGARLSIVAVVEPPPYGYSASYAVMTDWEYKSAQEKEMHDALEEAEKLVPPDLPITAQLLHGEPAHALAEYAEDFDLLITGSRGYGPVNRLLLGGVSGKLLHSSPCPVLVLPRGAGDAPLGEAS
jgi:nucleotide-binding universal stress UspA family protein